MSAPRKNTTRKHTGAGRPARRWPRVGPGLILAIAISVLIYIKMPRQPGPPPATPPQTFNEAPSAAPVALPEAPDPAWLLQQKGRLGLSPEQARRLAAKKARWDKETGGLQAQLASAERDFRAAMQENAKRPLSMQQIQERAAPVSDLTRQLNDARQAWWSDAANVLTPAQQRAAEDAWAHRFDRSPGTQKVQKTP